MDRYDLRGKRLTRITDVAQLAPSLASFNLPACLLPAAAPVYEVTEHAKPFIFILLQIGFLNLFD